MGGNLYGFVERRIKTDDFVDKWELVLKTEPIIGSASNFRELFYKNETKGYFPELPKNRGFPDDISAETRATMYSRIRIGHIEVDDIKINTEDIVYSNRSDKDSTYGDHRWALDLDFYRNFENSAFWIDYKQLKNIKWDQKIQESNIEDIVKPLSGSSISPGEVQKVFKLLIDGEKQNENWLSHNEQLDLTTEELRRLIEKRRISKNGRELVLKRKSMKEFLGDQWTPIWNIIEHIGDRELEELRLIFYWNH